MLEATEIRVGHVIRLNGKLNKVLHQEIRGTGKFGKTAHLKTKDLDEGNIHEVSLRAEDKVEDVTLTRAKMQYSYRDGDNFIFMNLETFEQYPISAKSIGKHDVFLTENMEIDVLFFEEKALAVDFPKTVELTVTSAPPSGGDRETYREVELENGLKILVPPFVKEGERVRVDTDDFKYVDRVTTKSM